jgi:hypothetical protein
MFILELLPKTVVSLRVFAVSKLVVNVLRKDFRFILLKYIDILKTVSCKTLRSQ